MHGDRVVELRTANLPAIKAGRVGEGWGVLESIHIIEQPRRATAHIRSGDAARGVELKAIAHPAARHRVRYAVVCGSQNRCCIKSRYKASVFFVFADDRLGQGHDVAEFHPAAKLSTGNVHVEHHIRVRIEADALQRVEQQGE